VPGAGSVVPPPLSLIERVRVHVSETHNLYTIALLSLGVTFVSPGVISVFSDVISVSSAIISVSETSAYVLLINAQRGLIFPSGESLKIQKSYCPAPQELVLPATIYPPSFVC